jgi:hypothetical protein
VLSFGAGSEELATRPPPPGGVAVRQRPRGSVKGVTVGVTLTFADVPNLGGWVRMAAGDRRGRINKKALRDTYQSL